jgi:hypothetical protein
MTLIGRQKPGRAAAAGMVRRRAPTANIWPYRFVTVIYTSNDVSVTWTPQNDMWRQLCQRT